MINLATPEIWFVTGSQHLYGPGRCSRSRPTAREIAGALDDSPKLAAAGPCSRPLLTTPGRDRQLCLEANSAPNCAGLILWMHTFSPSKMWIGGLNALREAVPASAHPVQSRPARGTTIDMDFMNLNQAAHGDREAGFIHTRMRLPRKVVVGHWSDPEVQDRVGAWMRAARAWHDWQGAKFCRFGDNMRQVAVTEGDKVAAEMKFGFAINGYGVGDLVDAGRTPSPTPRSKALAAEYEERYAVAPELRKGGARHDSLRYGARLELGLARLSRARAASRASPTRSRTCTA